PGSRSRAASFHPAPDGPAANDRPGTSETVTDPTGHDARAAPALAYHSPRPTASSASRPRVKTAAESPTRTVTRASVLSQPQSRRVSGFGPSPSADTHAAG